MNAIGINKAFGDDVLLALKDMQAKAQNELNESASKPSSGGMSFLETLEQGVKDVNQAQKAADKMGVAASTGKDVDLHEVMLAMTQAELSFNLMVQVRNRALEAYQEMMRMQV